MRERSVAEIVRIDVDRLPLPPEQEWVPAPAKQGSAGSLIGPLALGVLAAALVFATVRASLDDPTATLPEGGRALATGRSMPTPDPEVANRVSRLPNIFRNDTAAYRLLLPGDWRRSDLRSKTFAAGSQVVARDIYTTRSPDEEVRLAASGEALPWEMVVELWEARGADLTGWALAHESHPGQRLEKVELRSGSAIRKIWADGLRAAYYIARGEMILVISYTTTADSAAAPARVTRSVLDQAIRDIGLP